MITKETAMNIALAYREIEHAEALLADIQKEQDRFDPEKVDVRDCFGRRLRGLELGVPSGSDSHRIFNVPWSICRPVIETHIAAQRKRIADGCAAARMELDLAPPTE